MLAVGPSGGLETTLAVQTMGVHKAAPIFLRNATEGQTPEGCDANVRRAIALLRLFTQQIEAMQSLKGRTAQQKLVVEHVHMHQCGQAIVGAVDAGKPAKVANEEHAHAELTETEHAIRFTQEWQCARAILRRLLGVAPVRGVEQHFKVQRCQMGDAGCTEAPTGPRTPQGLESLPLCKVEARTLFRQRH